MIDISDTILEKKKKDEEGISIKEQLSFFVPLGMTSLLISLTHSLFNAALARISSPEIYLSAFAIAKSLLQVMQNPISMIRQTVTALVNDGESYNKVKRFTLILIVLLISLYAIFAFSGGARWTLKHIMGVDGRVLDEAVTIFKIFIFVPLAVTLRNFMQGIAIKLRRTPLVTLATIARVIFVALIVILVERLTFLPSGILAGLMFVGAISCEGLTMFLGVKIPTGNITKELDRVNYNRVKVDLKKVTNRLVLSFFGPLVLTSFIRSLARPMIDAGLARSDRPEIAIAVYAVAWSLGIIIVSPLMMFHQVPLNFIVKDGDKNIRSVKKFALYLGMTLSILIGIMSFSPIGYYILENYIGVTKEICNAAIDVLKIMTLLPLVMVIRQYYWGILMKKHMTKHISNGKIVNLISLAITILIVSLMKPLNPAIIGIIGMISSELFESIYLHRICSKQK